MACHEVSQGVGSPSLRGGGASGPGEGGLHRVRAVLREEGASTSLPPLRSLPPVLALLSPAPRGLLTWNLQDALIGGGAQCTQWLVKTVQSAHWALDETGYSNRWHEKVRHPWRLSPDIPTVQLPLARSWAAGGQREGTAQTSSTLHSLRVFTTAIALPWWDCTAWLIAVCLVGLGSRVNYTIYIFRINTECVWTKMSTLLSMGVTHYRPLYIHQVFPSFPFSMFSQGLAHLSVQTVGIAFQYHSRLNWLFHSPLGTERLWLRDMTRAELDRSQLGVKLWTFGIGVELVCDFWGLVSFCENEV